ncbi:MAG TPA: hypothetical protein VJV05_06230 [Pyrinomonadaceae bacterium]|nr:hypothetical protein [Pyrinomonadaceae bacterium]
MPLTRRTFLQSVIAAGVTFAVAGSGSRAFGQKVRTDGFPIPVEAYTDPLYSLTARDFEPLIGQTFIATSVEGQTRNLILTEVNRDERLGNAIRGTYGESYSLVFAGGGKERTLLTQDVYKVSGNGLEVEMLIVPVGRSKNEYQVVVNRLAR